MSHPASCIIVDDHEAVRAGTRARLGALDWIDVVAEATNADDAVEEIRRHRPDLVLMDIRIPGGSGTSTASVIAEEGIPSRIVIYSGYATTSVAEQALDAGVAGVVLKDSPLSTVVDALRSALDGKRYLDPTIAADIVAAADGPRPLSTREREILQRIADGGQNGTIAFDLGISIETVKAHVSNILHKLGAQSRTEAVANALREGVIQ